MQIKINTKMKKLKWYVYILECADKTLYCGITTDIDRRVGEHNLSIKGAKYTKARRPVSLVYCCERKNKSEASKEEYRIKKLRRAYKLKLIDKQ